MMTEVESASTISIRSTTITDDVFQPYTTFFKASGIYLEGDGHAKGKRWPRMLFSFAITSIILIQSLRFLWGTQRSITLDNYLASFVAYVLAQYHILFLNLAYVLSIRRSFEKLGCSFGKFEAEFGISDDGCKIARKARLFARFSFVSTIWYVFAMIVGEYVIPAFNLLLIPFENTTGWSYFVFAVTFTVVGAPGLFQAMLFSNLFLILTYILWREFQRITKILLRYTDALDSEEEKRVDGVMEFTESDSVKPSIEDSRRFPESDSEIKNVVHLPSGDDLKAIVYENEKRRPENIDYQHASQAIVVSCPEKYYLGIIDLDKNDRDLLNKSLTQSSAVDSPTKTNLGTVDPNTGNNLEQTRSYNKDVRRPILDNKVHQWSNLPNQKSRRKGNQPSEDNNQIDEKRRDVFEQQNLNQRGLKGTKHVLKSNQTSNNKYTTKHQSNVRLNPDKKRNNREPKKSNRTKNTSKQTAEVLMDQRRMCKLNNIENGMNNSTYLEILKNKKQLNMLVDEVNYDDRTVRENSQQNRNKIGIGLVKSENVENQDSKEKESGTNAICRCTDENNLEHDQTTDVQTRNTDDKHPTINLEAQDKAVYHVQNRTTNEKQEQLKYKTTRVTEVRQTTTNEKQEQLKYKTTRVTEVRRITDKHLNLIVAHHRSVCQLVSETNAFFQNFLVFVILFAIPTACFQCVALTNAPSLSSGYVVTCVLFALANLISCLCILYLPSLVHSAAHDPLNIVMDLETSGLSSNGSKVYDRFLNRLSSAPIGFNLYGFVLIKKSTLLAITGTLVTYMVVLIQFKPTGTDEICLQLLEKFNLTL